MFFCEINCQFNTDEFETLFTKFAIEVLKWESRKQIVDVFNVLSVYEQKCLKRLQGTSLQFFYKYNVYNEWCFGQWRRSEGLLAIFNSYPAAKISSAECLVCFKFHGALRSFNVCENVVRVSSSLYPDETPKP